jgi:serine---pyruvate transaminase
MSKKMMLPGPADIEEKIRLLGSKPLVYNRTPEFSDFISEIEEGLKYVFQTRNDVFILTCSGTGAMEAAVVNTLSKNDTVIVANNGTFGERWSEICEAYGVNVIEIKEGLGKSIDPKKVEENLFEEIKAVFVTIDETCCGALSDVEAIGKIVKNSNAILVVDAISSLGSDVFKTDEWNCDVVIASSHKGLAVAPGLAFMTMSEKAWKLVENSDLPSYYFNAKSYKNNIVRGQTPFTPAIAILYQLQGRLKKIKDETIEGYIQRYSILSQRLKSGILKLGLKLVPEVNSNFVLGIYTPEEVDAYQLVQIMKNKYDIFIAPSPGELKTKMIRIGTLGDITKEDVDFTIDCLKKTLVELGYSVD